MQAKRKLCLKRSYVLYFLHIAEAYWQRIGSVIRDSGTRNSGIKLYCSWSCFIPLTIQSLGKLRNGYGLDKLEGFLTPARAEPIFFSLSYILVMFPHRRDRKETEAWSKLHYKFVIDERCLSLTHSYHRKFSVTQQTEGFGCQNKTVSHGTMPQFSVLSLSVIRNWKSIKCITAKFSSTSTTLMEKVVCSAVPATVSHCSEAESSLWFLSRLPFVWEEKDGVSWHYKF